MSRPNAIAASSKAYHAWLGSGLITDCQCSSPYKPPRRRPFAASADAIRTCRELPLPEWHKQRRNASFVAGRCRMFSRDTDMFAALFEKGYPVGFGVTRPPMHYAQDCLSL